MSVPLQIPQHDLDVLQDALSSVKLRISTRPYVHGRSACVGWSDVRQAKRIAKFTQLPEVVNVQRLANKLIAKFYPGFQWTSLMLNKDSVAAAHQDKNNVNFSVAIVIFPGSKHPLDGALFSTDHGVICPANHMNMFNGNEEHYNESYEGSPRWSIIAFHHKSWARSQQWHADFLLDLEYNLPKTDDKGDDKGEDKDKDDDKDKDENEDEDPFIDDTGDEEEDCDDACDVVLNIEHMLGNTIKVFALPTDTMLVVKGYIRNKTNIRRDRQQLVLGLLLLEDTNTVSDYMLDAESNIKLILDMSAAAAGVKKTIQKNAKKLKSLQQELDDGAATLTETAQKDPDLKILDARIKAIIDAPNALKDAVFKMTLPDLMEFKEEYSKTSNLKTRGDMMAGIIFSTQAIEELDKRANAYSEIKDLLTSVAQVVYERNYAGTKSNKNTFADVMSERSNELAGVKKKTTAEARII